MKIAKSNPITWIIILGFLFCLAVPGCSLRRAGQYKQLKYPPMSDIQVPQVRRATLANGMQLFLVEDHELPAISVFALVRTGSIYEPADKIGLAAITGTVMRTGGTKTKTGDQIDEQLERIAASVETGIGLNSGYGSLWTLKEDFDEALSVFADVLTGPAFSEDKIELAKIVQRTAVARRNDYVRQIALREYLKLIYGPDSGYARHIEYATIDNITREDIIAFHKKFYCPNNIMLGVCGDFDTEQMIKKIQDAFGGWQKADIEIPSVPQVRYDFRPTVNVVRKDDINQSFICLGHIGGLMNDPDYFALVMMNQILGESFTSRLFKNVRSRQGLAYMVFGVYGADYDHPGVFYVGCQTKSEATVRAVRSMTHEVKKMTETEATDEELAIARDSYLNSFVFNFENKGQVMRRLMTYEYYGYPPDFLQKTKQNIEKVTKADILRVARKHLQPDKMQVLAVGRPQDFGEPLSALGQVREIDITIPSPK